MILYLIRHGQSMGNAWEDAYDHEDMNFLTDLGQDQARAAGKLLIGKKIDHWYASNLVRARHTLSLISCERDDWRRQYHLDRRLNEHHMWRTDREHEEASYNFFMDRLHPHCNDRITIGVVSHYYTMRYLFRFLMEKHEFTRSRIDGFNEYIPNAHVFEWDSEMPDRIRGLVPLPEAYKET